MNDEQYVLKQLYAYRQGGVTLDGICQHIIDSEDVLGQLLIQRYGEHATVFPLHLSGKGNAVAQYCTVRGDVDYAQDQPWIHDYLCLRWELLNYLINELEDMI